MVPNGWKITSLGEICSGKLQTGPFGSQLHTHEYTEKGVAVLTPKDLIDFRPNNKSAAKIPGHRRVTNDYFNAYKVLTPLYSEQRKIAKILSTWDKAIAITEKLIKTSQQQKKVLMQQLLTGKRRIKVDEVA